MRNDMLQLKKHKKVLQTTQETNGSEFHLVAELSECVNPEGYTSLTFNTVWTGAKNPKEQQTKYTVLLSPEAVFNLSSMLMEFGGSK